MYLYPPLANLNIEYSLSRSLLSIYSSVYRYRAIRTERTVSNKKKVCCLIYFFTFLIFPILFLFLGGLSSEFHPIYIRALPATKKEQLTAVDGVCNITESIHSWLFLFCFLLFFEIFYYRRREKRKKIDKIGTFLSLGPASSFFLREKSSAK
jgi:hypothetical protein